MKPFISWPSLALAVLLLAAPATVRAEDDAGAKEDTRNFAQRVIGDIRLGEGIQANQVTIFPLVTNVVPPETDVVADTQTPDLVFAEPEFPRRRYNVEVTNNGAAPVLLLGGTILEGGLRDRFVAHDVLLPPGKAIEIHTLPAASVNDKRKEAKPFTVSPILAPPYLQEKALFGGNHNLVTGFIPHFFEFRNEGDERRSLVAINDSNQLAQYCLVCHKTLAAFPEPKEPRQQVVGSISAVRGRIQSLVIFGENRLLRAYFEPMLKGHSFAAAAIELRAKKLGIPLPGQDDPEATLLVVQEEAQRLLDRLVLAKYRDDEVIEGQLGEALLLRTSDGTRGRALGLDGKLIHLVVFPHDPFENRLYSQNLNPPDEDLLDDPERIGLTEGNRRAATPGQRLTEAEKRVIDRLNEGLRRGAGLDTGPPGLGPRTPGGGGAGRRR